MRAKKVSESINFQRGKDPKTSMGIGIITRLKDLIQNSDLKKDLGNMRDEDRDETIPLWESAVDELPESYEFMGNSSFLEYYYEDLWELIKEIRGFSNSDNDELQTGTIEPTYIPEWFEDEDLLGHYELYSPGILLVGEKPGPDLMDDCMLFIDKNIINF